MIHLQGNTNSYYENETREMVSYGSGGSSQQRMRGLPGVLNMSQLLCVCVCACTTEHMQRAEDSSGFYFTCNLV